MSYVTISSKTIDVCIFAGDGKPCEIRLHDGEDRRKVTYVVRPGPALDNRTSLWTPITSKSEKSVVYCRKAEWKLIRETDRNRIETIFQKVFPESAEIAKKVRLDPVVAGRHVTGLGVEWAKGVANYRMAEMIALARLSPNHRSKIALGGGGTTLRCKTTEDGNVQVYVSMVGPFGSFKKMRTEVVIGSTKEIRPEERVYAYLKLRNLKKLAPEGVKRHIDGLRHEIATLEMLHRAHARNILQLYDVEKKRCTIEGKDVEAPVGMRVEWCGLGDAEWITKDPPKPGTPEYDDCLRIAYDAAVGIRDMHAVGILHGDIKTKNLFLKTENGRIVAKWGDFGGALGPGAHIGIYSLPFLDPELLFGKEKMMATKAAEIWSLGILLLQLFHGRESNECGRIYPTDILSKVRTQEELDDFIQQVEKAFFSMREKLRPGNLIDDCIDKCLRDSKSRPSAEALVAALQKILPPPSGPHGLFVPAAQETQRILAWKKRVMAL